ncbi:MAG TPA: FAD:protein FMN transferase [Burkholderiaceae bacterium]
MRRVLVPAHLDPVPPPGGSVVARLEGRTMGTGWNVQYAAPAPLAGLQAALESELIRLNDQMSHWQSGSELDRYNEGAAGSWHALSAEFFHVLHYALDLCEQTAHAFDPAAGALVDLWGFGAHGQHASGAFTPPSQGALVSALAARRPLALDPVTRSVLQPGGQRLDLSGVAKGYAVDHLSLLLERHGCRHYLVEIGGELRGAGMKPDGQPWWVELEQGVSTLAALHGLACATSGDYRRYFDYSGRRYAHTIDPRTGLAVDNGVHTVTVLAPQCMHADAWATALTVLGPAAGIALADRHGIAARILCRDGERISAAFTDMLG